MGRAPYAKSLTVSAPGFPYTHLRGSFEGGKEAHPVLSEATPASISGPRIFVAGRHRASATPILARATAVLVLVALCVAGAGALITAGRPAISSDESLYLAEAVSIAAGHGPAYTTGAPIVHRPFLYPALIAAEVKAVGPDSAAVYWLPRLAALAAAAALGILVGRAFGTIAGAAAGALALASTQVGRLGNSLYVDVTESLFLLLALLALSELRHRPSIRACTGAGLLLAAAFWTKESALLLAPLPFVLLAFQRRSVTRRDVAGLACYSMALGVPLGAWWLWVAHQTGFTFLARAVGAGPAYLLAGAPLVAGLALLAAAAIMRRPFDARLPRRIVGAAFIVAWQAFWLWGLERHSWPYPHDYLATVPGYVWHVGPNVQPFFLLIPAWLYVAWRAIRGGEAHAQIALAAALFLPFFIFTANRSLDLRDSLPLVYLSFGAIAITVTDGARWVATRCTNAEPASWAALVTAAAITLAVVPQVVRNYETGLNPAEASGGADWNGSVARGTAQWIEKNVPPGDTIMTSRLYSTSIFSLSGGRYPVVQVPTLRVQFDGAILRPMSTQFRWEDDQLWRYGRGSWLYLRRYPQKGYDIGLTQDDLLADLRRRDVRYLVVTGEDAGFSSLTYLNYYLDAPGLQLVHVESAGPADAAYVFSVDTARLASRPFPLTLNRETEAALRRHLGDRYDEAIRGLAPSLRVSDEAPLPDTARTSLAGNAGMEPSR